MKLKNWVSFGLVLACVPGFASTYKSDKGPRLEQALKLLNEALAAGTYVGKTEDGEKCSATVETTLARNGKAIVDYDLSLAIHNKKDDAEGEFNLFDDGRDFSDSWVVEIATISDRKRTNVTVHALIKEVDDDGDVTSLKAPALMVSKENATGKVAQISVDKIDCLLK